MYTQFPIMGELHLTSVSIFHDMICPLKFASKAIVCVVVEMLEQHVCKVILVISLSLGHAEQKFIKGIVVLSDVVQLGPYKHKNMLADTHETAYIPSLKKSGETNISVKQFVFQPTHFVFKNSFPQKYFGSQEFWV